MHYALTSAAWFFQKYGLFTVADMGIQDPVVAKITKRVNGARELGLSGRIQFTKEFYSILTA